MEMKRSKVLDKLRAGEVVTCTKLNLNDSRVVEIAALSGVDCIWTDMEHVPNDFSFIEKQILAAKAYNTDIMVRVARGSYSDHVKPLEIDASGILVPHIMSLDDAKNVVRMTRFHPIGRRPVDGGNADGSFCGLDFNEYLKQANERRFVCIQIEDPEPMDQLDDIAALEGIDMLFFGPGDFSQGIGAPGQWDNPELLKAREKVAQVAVKHGKYAATVGSPANIKDLTDIGYRFISMGADVVGLSQYFSGIMSGFNKETLSIKSIYGGEKK